MGEQGKQRQQDQIRCQKRRLRITAIGAAIGAAAGCAALVLFLWNPDPYALDPMAQDGPYHINDGAATPAEVSYFRLQINSVPEAAFGEKLPFFIGNPKENKELVQVRIYLEDTGEELYASPVLKPGERQVYGEIDPALAPGAYPAVAVFTLLDADGRNAVGSMETGVTITIRKE